MDSIHGIKIAKDSSFAMLLAAQRRNWPLWYMELSDLYLSGGQARARMRPLQVMDDRDRWYELGGAIDRPLSDIPVLMMRKDPPVDADYLNATFVLELAERAGSLVVNRPQALRDANEKIAATWFPELIPPTLVSSQRDHFIAFHEQHGDMVLKPLDGMGGRSIFRVKPGDINRNVIIETLTRHGSRLAMAQRFIPEIRAGDKRILVVDGEPVPYALARIPAAGESRGNLAVGGEARGVALSARDREIVDRVAPELVARGVLFAGLDVIGDYLTEVNITSPTCIRELDALYNLDIAGMLLDRISTRLAG